MAARGLSPTEIGRMDCPRSTVRAWLTPTARSADGRDATCCSGCGAVHLTAETEPAAYAYLLGLYLGDGCISAHARGVFRLRITLDTRHPGIIEECRVALSAVAPRNKVGVRLRSGGGGRVSCRSTVAEESTNDRSFSRAGRSGSSTSTQVACCAG